MSGFDHLPDDELAGDELVGGNEYVDDLESGSSLSLFEGDEGTLSFKQRKTLQALLKRRYVSASTTSDLWPVLLESRRVIASRLNDLFLELHLDVKHQVAYKRQARSEGGAIFPTLLHDGAYNREETLILVHLRSLSYRQRSTSNDVVFVDRDDILTHAEMFRPERETDLSGFASKIGRAIDSLVKDKLLTSSQDQARYRIEPIVDALLSLKELERLLGVLRDTNAALLEPTLTDDSVDNAVDVARGADSNVTGPDRGSDAGPGTEPDGETPSLWEMTA